MARKLYLFGIGGTGSRVLKSVAMLMAAGCKLRHDFDTVIPMIIDPDVSNGDLNKTKDVFRLYQEIRNQVHQPENFYSQEIKTIHELANNSSHINPDFYQFKLDDVEHKTFGEYIGFNSLKDDASNGSDDKSFTRLLYSDRNLKSSLDVGFKGNPNMGSIVLNQFSTSENFKRFAQTFNAGDAVFIISSIFGGTGAAGFPLLLKNLRGNNELPNHAEIKDAMIGGITYLPYFALDKKDEIDSESFDEKAKIAIDYYNRTIINNNQIDSLYFIGNKGSSKHFQYSVGGKEQMNDAHFLELAGALAVFDFCETIDHKPEKTQVKEFGIERDSENIVFNDLNNKNSKFIALPLTKFKLYAEYLNKGLQKALNVSRWTKSDIKFVSEVKNSPLNQNYFNSAEFKNQISAFNNHFLEWLQEMEENKPAFSPFQTVSWGNALALVKGITPSKGKSFKAIDIENCRLIDDADLRAPTDKKHTALIKLFDTSTHNVLQNSKILNQLPHG